MALHTPMLFEWTTKRFQVISNNQGFDSDGNYFGGEHFLQINKGKVSADGMEQSESTHFIAYTAEGDDNKTYMALECTGGHFKHHMVAIIKGQLTYMKKTRAYKKISDVEPEVLFIKQSSSSQGDVFRMQHADDLRQFVGFNEIGVAIAPSSVSADGKEAQLFDFSIEAEASVAIRCEKRLPVIASDCQ